MIGVCSYLLIGFWFTRLSATKSAQKAMLVNRVSDTFLIISLVLMWWYAGSLDYGVLFSNTKIAYYTDWICLTLLIGAMGKSAQVGLHVWLADAMEGNLLLVILTCLFFDILSLPTTEFNPEVLMIYNCFTPFQKEVLTGLLLSDGSIRNPNSNRRTTGNKRLECTFKKDHLDFIKWLKFDILGSLSTSTRPTLYPKNNPTQYWFCTKNHQFFNILYDQWYFEKDQKKVKILPNDIEKDLSPVSLAFWIMGDGYWEKNSKTIFLCTENFSIKEIIFLISILQKNFGLYSTLKKRKHRFRIRLSRKKENINRLRKLVRPYFHLSMLYKLGIDSL